MNWRRIVALAVPVAVLLFTLGFIVALDQQRGPNWRLELDEYVIKHTTLTETVRVQTVTRATRPSNFTAAMGTAQPGDWIIPSTPPQAVRCALVLRSRPPGSGDLESLRQVVYLAYHSDALYRVGWLAYEGPQEPFGPQLEADLASVGCDLGLE
jgi:hypothetical protein